jgi:transcriptional regulator NrdR family protein
MSCTHDNSKCTDTRAMPGYRKRRYKCLDCGERYSTIEVVVATPEAGIKSLLDQLKQDIK